MTQYTVRAPDGKQITLEGPPGASQADILAQAQKLYTPNMGQFGGQAGAGQPAPPPKAAPPPGQPGSMPMRAMLAMATGNPMMLAPGPKPTTADNARITAEERAKTLPGFARSMAQGASSNFADEADARMSQGTTALSNLLKRATGKPIDYTGQEIYDATMAAERGQRNTYAKEHPVANTVAGLAGGLATAPMYLVPGAGAAGIAGNAARGAVAGAGYGALAGAGAGEGVKGRALGAAIGAGTGAVTGGALGAGGAAVSSAIERKAASAAAKGLDPTDNDQVRAALVRALARDKASPADVTASLAAEPTRPAFLSAGENLKGLAEVAAQTPGTARNTLADSVRGYQAAAADTIKSDIGTALGGQGDYFATLDKAIQTRRDAASAGIKDLGEHLVTLDQDSVMALRSDLAQSAIKDAAKNALAHPDPELRNSGATLNQLGAKLLDKPSATTIRVRDAQDVSKSLLDAADSAFKSGDGARGTALKALGKTIRENAGNPDRGGFSEYGAWLKQYGDDSDNIGALELGRNVLKNTMDMSAENLSRQLKEMPDSAQDYFRKGVGEALIAQVRSAKGDIGTMRQILRSSEMADRVKLAFPTQGAFDNFMASAGKRVADQDSMSMVLGNSRTAFRQAAQEDLAGPQGNIDAALSVIDQGLSAPHTAPLKLARQLLKQVPRKDRGVLTNDASNQALGEALTNPARLAEILKAQDAASTAANSVPGRKRIGTAAGVGAVQANEALAKLLGGPQ